MSFYMYRVSSRKERAAPVPLQDGYLDLHTTPSRDQLPLSSLSLALSLFFFLRRRKKRQKRRREQNLKKKTRKNNNNEKETERSGERRRSEKRKVR